ncbi:glycoside hydrolase family 95 protein [Gaetbulibacter saemankumensis]|uniref:glycoside hydrolase family 95 protein n=1 Tax=Gaetbulibacter saemankumensis TaxID=311208 RepID=UPI001B7FE205|nr:glycoside hydrolase family 95 protein [Gaetbulibacter saemankumensis]
MSIQKTVFKGQIRRCYFMCVGIIFAFMFVGCTAQDVKNEDILWYRSPAKSWNEALPLGNGKLGAMVFGKTSAERIQLNDDSMWPGDMEDWTEPEGTQEDLEKIRALLFEGKQSEADQLFVDKFSRKTIVRSHQTMGDLFIDFDHQDISDYRRELNLNKALATVSYKSGGSLVTEQVFTSHPHKAIIIKLTSDAPEGLNARLTLSRPQDMGYDTAKVSVSDDSLLLMQGEVTQRAGKFNSEPYPILEGVKFETMLKVNHQGGNIEQGKDYLKLDHVKEATIYIVSNSSYYFDSYQDQNKLDMKAVASKSFDKLLKEHIEDYQKWYSRLDFQLTGVKKDSLPIDERLDRVKKGAIDLGLEELLYKYGRYLLISSSRVGTNPANLQGLWNDNIEAPWNGDYHLNINLQMNYWLADVANLGELNNPLFDYIDRLVENGKKTASKNFGCRGSFIPHATDLWATTWLRAPTAYWGCSIGGGGWLMQHYWQHYEFTQDKMFLKERALPAIEEVAKFYSDWIIEDPRDGYLISAPSTSPENRYLNEAGEPVASCLGSAMDQQVIYEVFNNYIKACDVLNINHEFLEKVKQQKSKLRPGFVIGDDGRVLEWDRPYKELEPGHRHMSHLYGFHPGNQITKANNPEIFKAVRNTLDYRLENGGAGPGWSRAWLINCSARLLDGNMAHEHIQLLLKRSTDNNLFNSHPPFQIDGNFGYTAGVSEMLLQSHEEGIIRLLPALPDSWERGHIKGLKARGGLTVDMSWSNNLLDYATIRSARDNKITLMYQGEAVNIEIKSGDVYIFEPSIKEN